MDIRPTAKLSPIALLRVLVARFGEKAPLLSQPRWPTQFITEAGSEFSRQSFPPRRPGAANRTFLSAFRSSRALAVKQPFPVFYKKSWSVSDSHVNLLW